MSPHPIIWQTAFFTLYAHSLFFALGAELSFLFLLRLLKKSGLNMPLLAERFLLGFAGSLLGARIGYLLTYPDQFHTLGQVLAIWQGGLVSFWGIATGILLIWLLFGRQVPKEEAWKWGDLLALSTALGWGIGRIGNFLAGDSNGLLSAQWFYFYQRVPVSLGETLLTFSLVAGLLLYRRKKQLRAGNTFFIILLGYLLGRFLIDFWRDEPIILLGLKISQLAGLFFFILTYSVYRIYARPKK